MEYEWYWRHAGRSDVLYWAGIHVWLIIVIEYMFEHQTGLSHSFLNLLASIGIKLEVVRCLFTQCFQVKLSLESRDKRKRNGCCLLRRREIAKWASLIVSSMHLLAFNVGLLYVGSLAYISKRLASSST